MNIKLLLLKLIWKLHLRWKKEGKKIISKGDVIKGEALIDNAETLWRGTLKILGENIKKRTWIAEKDEYKYELEGGEKFEP